MTLERVNPFSGFFSSIVYPLLPMYNIQRSSETQHRLYGATDRVKGENTQCLISCAAKKSSQYLGRAWLSTFLWATASLSGMKIIPSVSSFPRTWLRDGFVRQRDYCISLTRRFLRMLSFIISSIILFCQRKTLMEGAHQIFQMSIFLLWLEDLWHNDFQCSKHKSEEQDAQSWGSVSWSIILPPT